MPTKLYFGKLIKDHPAVKISQKGEAFIWRYMNFTRLISLFDRKALFFPSINTLKTDDPFEGAWSIGHWKAVYGKKSVQELLEFKESIDENTGVADHVGKYTYVNCWHISNHESHAMWKLYGNEIAIRSTITKLSTSFLMQSDDRSNAPLFIGEVQYIDYMEDPMSENLSHRNFLYPTFRKNKSFEHEHELRVASFSPEQTEDQELVIDEFGNTFMPNMPLPSKGVSFAVDLSILIESIHLSPQVESWYKDLVLSVMSKYELDISVFESALNTVPKL